jgi:fermentation-respiration switch protein FrsA (DUF1100 family)
MGVSTVIAFVAAVAVAYGLLVGVLYTQQRHLLYLPDRSRPSLVEAGVPGLAAVETATGDGLRLLAWYRPAPEGRPTILYFHGNGGHIGYRADRVQVIASAGLGVMLAEYRGYGGNPGSPSEEGFHSDAVAALDFLRARSVRPADIVLYGESLGTAVAVRLAAELAAQGTPVGALILEAPFTSIADVAQHHYFYVPARALVKDKFDAASRIAAVKAPVLVIHGEADMVVPVSFGRALLAAAAEPKRGWFPARADHATIFHGDAMRIIDGFLRDHLR